LPDWREGFGIYRGEILDAKAAMARHVSDRRYDALWRFGVNISPRRSKPSANLAKCGFSLQPGRIYVGRSDAA